MWGEHAAMSGLKFVYQLRKTASSVLFRTCTRTVRNDCTVNWFQRICCFLTMRLAMTSLTVDSTQAVEIGSLLRWR